jgi:adenine deaminase
MRSLQGGITMTNQPIHDQMDEADLIVHNAKVTTLQDNGSDADAFAVRGERFVAVGDGAEVMRLRGNHTWLIDVGGRRVIPGLNDSHLHAIRSVEDVEGGERTGVQGTTTFFIDGVLYRVSWEREALLPALQAASRPS